MVPQIKRGSDQAIIDRMAELSTLTNDEIIAKIREMAGLSVKLLMEWAALFRLADDRGIDLSEFRTGLARWVHRIAFGQLDAELVAKYQTKPMIISKASKFVLSDQRRIASDEPLEVVILRDGGFDAVMIRPSLLDADQMRRVFASDHIRSEEEQIAFIRSSQVPLNPRRKRVFSGIALQRRKGITVKAANRFISVSELTEILNELV